MIDAKRIEEMKRLSAEATEGGWSAVINVPKWQGFVIAKEYDDITSDIRVEDAQFIAKSRQFVPDIIAAYEESKVHSAFWYEQFTHMTDAYAEQEEEIAKLRKALEFYADLEIYECSIEYDITGEPYAGDLIVEHDAGYTAREALK